MKDIILVEDRVPYGKRYILAVHGLSQLLMIDDLTVLYDVGADYRVLFHNAQLLGVNLRDVDVIVLSHGHYDHANDLDRVLQAIGKKGVPVVFHKAALDKKPPLLANITLESIVAWGGKPVAIEEPYELKEGVIVSGTVPRVSGNPYHPVVSENGDIVDEVLDDMSLFVDVKEKGVAVFTGCAHSGIINIVEYAKKIMNEDRVYAIVGGLHGERQRKDVIDKTVKFLKGLGVEILAPMHCSGSIRDGVMDERAFVDLRAGSELTF